MTHFRIYFVFIIEQRYVDIINCPFICHMKLSRGLVTHCYTYRRPPTRGISFVVHCVAAYRSINCIEGRVLQKNAIRKELSMKQKINLQHICVYIYKIQVSVCKCMCVCMCMCVNVCVFANKVFQNIVSNHITKEISLSVDVIPPLERSFHNSFTFKALHSQGCIIFFST